MVRRVKLLHGHWTERNLLPLLSNAEERVELVPCSRLVRASLQRVHQGKLRLPTGRRTSLLTKRNDKNTIGQITRLVQPTFVRSLVRLRKTQSLLYISILM